MGEITGGSDKAEIEKIIRYADGLRGNYLQGHFWPVCGMIGGVLLFFIAAVIVPP
jgi:hypothetical protein